MNLGRWFHRLGSPRWFYRISGRWLPWLGAAAAILLIVGAVWGLAFAPPDYRQGNSYRIIYIHVPASFIALAGYYVMAGAGAVSLIWKIKLADMVLKSAAKIGAAMTLLALISGSVWGKPTWGTWWVWDARITSMLVLFFLYLGIIALYQAFDREEQAAKACAILALVGTVNIPIIYKSVDWWFTLHQGATIRLLGHSTIAASMLHPLLVMIAGFYVLYVALLLAHTRTEVLRREHRTTWVRELVQSI